jgi:predicted transcriptional regulator
VPRIPAVDDHQRVQGIISMADVVRRDDVDSAETRNLADRIGADTRAPQAAGEVQEEGRVMPSVILYHQPG